MRPLSNIPCTASYLGRTERPTGAPRRAKLGIGEPRMLRIRRRPDKIAAWLPQTHSRN